MIRMQERNDQFIETALPFWNDLTPQDKTQLKRAIQKRHFSAGTPLHNGESGCSGLLLVYSGQVQMCIRDSLYTGLLEHNFRNPDTVGLRVASPREHTRVLAVPRQKGMYNFRYCFKIHKFLA